MGASDHHDAAVGGRRGVDVVEADAGTPHHHQVLAGLEHLGRDLGGRADDQGVGPDDRLQQRLGREVQTDVDVVAGVVEALQPTVRDRLGDEHS